jgi:hypothetical protein
MQDKEDQKSHICFSFYQQKRCRFGDSCRFQHVLESSMPCKFYNSGHCKLGNKCSYQHTVKLMVPRPPVVITDHTGKCKAYFDSVNELWNPRGSCKYGDRCRFRHYLTEEEQKAQNDTAIQTYLSAATTIHQPKAPEEADDKTIGWTKIHDLVFHAEYEKLANVLQSTNNHSALLSAMTHAPKTIHWSEFDTVDGSTDRYTITIPANSTPLDVAFTSSNDLTRGIAALYNLFDATDDRIPRFVCATLLLHPTRAREILAYVNNHHLGVAGIVSWNGGDGWTILHELCFRGNYELFTTKFYYFNDYRALMGRGLSASRIITWSEVSVTDNEANRGSHSNEMKDIKTFKMTIPSGYTVRQMVLMTSEALDRDSPCREQTKKYLFDSVEQSATRRQLVEYIDKLCGGDSSRKTL